MRNSVCEHRDLKLGGRLADMVDAPADKNPRRVVRIFPAKSSGYFRTFLASV